MDASPTTSGVPKDDSVEHLHKILRIIDHSGEAYLNATHKMAPYLVEAIERCLGNGLYEGGHWWDCMTQIMDSPPSGEDDSTHQASQEILRIANEARTNSAGYTLSFTKPSKEDQAHMWILYMLNSVKAFAKFMEYTMQLQDVVLAFYSPDSLLGADSTHIAPSNDDDDETPKQKFISLLCELGELERISFDPYRDVKILWRGEPLPELSPTGQAMVIQDGKGVNKSQIQANLQAESGQSATVHSPTRGVGFSAFGTFSGLLRNKLQGEGGNSPPPVEEEEVRPRSHTLSQGILQKTPQADPEYSTTPVRGRGVSLAPALMQNQAEVAASASTSASADTEKKRKKKKVVRISKPKKGEKSEKGRTAQRSPASTPPVSPRQTPEETALSPEKATLSPGQAELCTLKTSLSSQENGFVEFSANEKGFVKRDTQSCQTTEESLFLMRFATDEEIAVVQGREQRFQAKLAEHEARERAVAEREETLRLLAEHNSELGHPDYRAETITPSSSHSSLPGGSSPTTPRVKMDGAKLKDIITALRHLHNKARSDVSQGSNVRREVFRRINLAILAATTPTSEAGNFPFATPNDPCLDPARRTTSQVVGTPTIDASGSQHQAFFSRTVSLPSTSASSSPNSVVSKKTHRNVFTTRELDKPPEPTQKQTVVKPAKQQESSGTAIIVDEESDNEEIDQLQKQNHSCPGCDIDLKRNAPMAVVTPGSIGSKRLPRRCSYDNKLYCRRCHTNKEATLPAKIVAHWDFKTYKVSNPSLQFLQKVGADPLLHIQALNAELYEKVARLSRARKTRRRLKQMLELLRFYKANILVDDPSEYVVSCPDAYSVNDLHLLHGKDHEKYFVMLSGLEETLVRTSRGISQEVHDEVQEIMNGS